MKILFITHETSRTGAPMVVLHFLKWLQDNKPEVIVDVLAIKAGGLEDAFIKNCHTFYNYSKLTTPKPLTLWQRVLLKLKLFKKLNVKAELLEKITKTDYTLVYANTIVSIPLASEIINVSPKTKFVAHVHELNGVINQLLPNLKAYVPDISFLIAVSDIVKDNLIQNWGVPSEKVSRIYECSVNKSNLKLIQKKKEKFIIGGSGTVEWRKGSDLFIQVAKYIFTYYPDCDMEFNWVGSVSSEDCFRIQEDLKKGGLVGKVNFVGLQKDPYPFFKEFDVFLMTSREDPFPLVCIEVGLLGTPIICFKYATGTAEVLKKGGGRIVNYLDIRSMSDEIMFYYKDDAKRREDGKKAKILFSEFTPENICPIVFNKLQKLL